MTNHFVQAYRQAPWRVQLQWIGLFLLGLIAVALVAGIYLNVSARASSYGRDIQQLENQSDQIQRNIADLQTRLAMLTSASVMQKRAEDLGFQPIDSGSLLYVNVPVNVDREPAVLAPPPGPGMVSPPIIQSSYTQSLWDWLFEGLTRAAQQQGKALP